MDIEDFLEKKYDLAFVKGVSHPLGDPDNQYVEITHHYQGTNKSRHIWVYVKTTYAPDKTVEFQHVWIRPAGMEGFYD